MSYFDDNEDRIIYGRWGARVQRRNRSAEPGSELARARQAAHRAFDPTWQSGKLTRNQAYADLAKKLGIKKEECHMLLFDVEMCRKVVHLYSMDDFEDVS